MNRTTRKQNAEVTVKILEKGTYNVGEEAFDIQEDLVYAKDNSVLYSPSNLADLPTSQPHNNEPTDPMSLITLNTTSLAAAKALVDGGSDVCVLNFASAKNRGGGFRSGAQAQEEALARATGLFECQNAQQVKGYYDTHNLSGTTGLYSHRMIYSPDVPVFRDDDDNLMRPWKVSTITSCAVNAGAVKKNSPSLASQIQPTLAERATYVLRVARAHGHKHLILGAWGCGVFRNPPESVAQIWRTALDENEFAGCFKAVVFAVLDNTAKLENFRAFEKMFNSPSS